MDGMEAVDIQPKFLDERISYIVDRIQKLIQEVDYSLYFQALFHAADNSIWHKQVNWTLPKTDNMFSTSKMLTNPHRYIIRR